MLSRSLVIIVALVAALAFAASPSGAAVIPGQYVVVLKDGADAGAAAKKAKSLGGTVSHEYRHALKGYAAKLSDSQVAKVKAESQVLSVEPDRETKLAARAQECGPETDPFQPCQVPIFAIDRIAANQSSATSGDGRGSVPVNVAVIDDGIDATHPDLNVAGTTTCTHGNGKPDPFGAPPGWHGTMVGGFIAALDNAIGRVGIAPGARLWSVDVLNDAGSGTTSELVCGIDRVTATRKDTDPANDIVVANMSLGGDLRGAAPAGSCADAPQHAEPRAICGAVAAGVTLVASAGNDASDFQEYTPATFNEVLTVTAMGDNDGQPGGLGGHLECEPEQFDDRFAFFSNFATLGEDKVHTVAAPGVCLGSTFPGGLYARGSGTSYSTPLVTGTVALCLASGKKPCARLTPPQIVQKIVADATAYNTANPSYGFTGDPLHSPDPNKYYGYLVRAGLY